jgi:HEAT repeat protein
MSEKSFDELFMELKSDDVKARQTAVYELGKLDDERVPQTLIAALSDKNDDVRGYAVLTITNRHFDSKEYSLYPFKSIPESPFYIKPLVEYLNFEQHERNIESAIFLLGIVGGKSAFPNIISFLNNTNPFIRLAVIHALHFQGNDVALPYFLNALKDNDPWVRSYAVSELGSFHSQTTIRALITVLVDTGVPYPRGMEDLDTEAVGVSAQEQLIKFGNKTINFLIETFDNLNENRLLRARVGAVLIELGDNRAAEHLVSTLEEMFVHDTIMWKLSADALAKIGEKRAVQILSVQSQNRHLWTAAVAKSALMKIQIVHETSVAKLLIYLQDKNQSYYIHEATRERLKELGYKPK